MGQYPWGFTGVTPNASDNIPDKGSFDGQNLVFTDDGALPGAPEHHYAALVGTALHAGLGHDRRPVLGPAARPPLHRHRAGRAGRAQAVAVRRRPVRPRHRRRADLHALAPGRRLEDRVAGRRRLRPGPGAGARQELAAVLRDPAAAARRQDRLPRSGSRG